MKLKWSKEGKDPDYRFSLANERTFLAWIRTSLAFLAAAIGLDQLAPNLVTPPVRIAISVLLCLMAAYFALMSYRRWRANELAMRHEQPLTYTRHLSGIALLMVGIGIMIGLVIML